MRTIEEILIDARKRGLTLAALHQLVTMGVGKEPSTPYDGWGASFRHATGFRDLGTGKTAVEALEDALSRSKGEQGPENRPIIDIPKAKEPSLEDML